MSDRLSISAAAHECPDGVALIVGARSYTYAELADMVAHSKLDAGAPRRASATLETALVLYSSLQSRQELVLVSPTLSESELQNITQRLSSTEKDNAALVLFTSGSSGVSKGVLLGRDGLVASAVAANKVLEFANKGRWLCCLPLSHIGGLSVLLRSLVARQTTVLQGGFDAQIVQATIEAQRITHISLVPTMLWRLLEAGIDAPSGLRITLMGGAAIDDALVQRAKEAGYVLRSSYGMTETSSMVVCDGHALPNVELRTGDDCTLLIRGPMVMQGYLAPHQGDSLLRGGWLRTSDRARIDKSGHLEVLGRADCTIISGGENIDLLEVEAALLRLPNVRECVAVGVADPEWGQRLVALVVGPSPSETLRSDVLLEHKQPKQFVFLDSLPLLENGKIDRGRAQLLASAKQN
ncbi:MAG: AMP-binding protein [Myxococcales bacterium]|nr:AMP-binding protein [Myxococcales bacterium]